MTASPAAPGTAPGGGAQEATPVEALAAEWEDDAHVAAQQGASPFTEVAYAVRTCAEDARQKLAPAWDALTAERTALAAELQGVHGELKAAGIKGDPENHWAPLMVSMLARDRRVTAAENDRLHGLVAEILNALDEAAFFAPATRAAWRAALEEARDGA